MATYQTVLQHELILQGAFDERRFKAINQSGVLDIATFDEAYPKRGDIHPGTRLHIPIVALPAPYTRVNLGSSSAASFTKVSTNDQQFPVLRDDSRNKYTRYDDLISDIQGIGGFSGALEKRLGNQIAKRVMAMLGIVCKAAVQVVSPSRIADYTGYRADWPMISEAKTLAGDISDDLNVLVCHSQVYNALMSDFNHAKYNTAFAASIQAGEPTHPFMGLDAVIQTDTMPIDLAGGGTCAQSNTYWSFLLRGHGKIPGVNGALFYGYQSQMDLSTFYYPLDEVPGWYLRAPIDYVLSPRGFAFNGADNPSDVDLADPSLWALATDDLRQIGIVAIKTEGLLGNIRSGV